MSATAAGSVWRRLRGGTSRNRAIVAGTASAAFAKVLTTLLSLVSLPLTVRYFGPERYGVWITIISTSAWLAVFEFGLTDTITNAISTAHAQDDRNAAARYTTNAVLIAASFAALLLLAGSLVWRYVDWTFLFHLSSTAVSDEVRSTVAIACLLVMLTPLCTLGLKILSGYQQTHVANIATCLGSVLSVAGLIIGMKMHLSMPRLYLCSSGLLTLSGIGTLVWSIVISKPWLRPRLHHVSASIGRNLLSTGLPFFVIRLAGVVVFSTDNILVGHYLGAAEVTPFSVCMRVMMYAQLVPGFIFPSLWAAYAEANSRGDSEWIRKTYTRTMRMSILLIVAPVAVLVFVGQWLIRLWAGPAAVPTQSLLLAMAVWTVISGITGVQSCLLGAVQRNRVQAAVSILAAVVNLTLSIMLVQRMGAIGSVVGTIVSYALIVGPQSWAVRRYFAETHGAVREDILAAQL